MEADNSPTKAASDSGKLHIIIRICDGKMHGFCVDVCPDGGLQQKSGVCSVKLSENMYFGRKHSEIEMAARADRCLL